MKKYKISTDEKDRINLGNLNKGGMTTITIGSSTFSLAGNSSMSVNGMKIVCRNGRVYVNGKLIEQEGQENRYAYRIIALEDVRDDAGKILVKAGEKGGYVESEENLSQEGTCWIYNDAVVIEKAKVSGSAQIRNDANISGSAKVCDNAIISDDAQIYNSACVSGYAKIYGDAEVYDKATITDEVKVCKDAEVCGDTTLTGKQCVKKSIIPENSDSNDLINGMHISIGGISSTSKSNNINNKFLKDPYNKGETKDYRAKNQTQFDEDFGKEL